MDTFLISGKLYLAKMMIEEGGIMIKKREEVIAALLKADGFLTAHQLAQDLKLSTKTIYRAVKEINQSFGQPVIISERGKGLLLDYDRYLMLSNELPLAADFIGVTPVERRNAILTKLLFTSPLTCRVDELYEPYHVSYDLMQYDLQHLTKILTTYHLKLLRRGNRLSIAGDEQAIRRLINKVLMQSNAMNVETIRDFASRFPDMENYDQQFLTAQLELIQRSFQTSIPYPYNINIFSHLYVLMKRYRTGKVQASQSIQLSPQDQALIHAQPIILKVAKNVMQNVGEYVQHSIEPTEINSLVEYLLSMRYSHEVIYDSHSTPLCNRLVETFLNGFDLDEHATGIQTLRNDLISHLRPMMNRLNNQIQVANKLLPDIKLEYGELFARVQHLAQQAQTSLSLPWSIDEDEVGFITLYFAKYFEETEFHQRALVMCASGVGTSKLLCAKVHKRFPNLEIVGITSKAQYEAHPERYQGIDLIITTVEVQAHNQECVMLTNALFTVQDQKRLGQLLGVKDGI